MVVVNTSSFAENLRNAEAYLKSNCCVLLQGAASSGKSVLAGSLAELHNATFISINLDDTFDSKDLLGKFSAKDTPGVFEWVAGPLTKAVMEGSWIVLEDVDLASFDVFTMLLPLMSTNKLFIADKGVTLTAHPSFRLIATQQTTHYGEGSISTKKGTTLPSAEMWPTIVMVEPSSEEKVEVARTLYPSTPIEPLQSLMSELPPRKSGLRDILKWSRRCSLYVTPQSSNNGFLASGIREKLFCESVDCFVAGLVPGEEQVTMWKIVAQCCGVDEGTASSLMYDRKPEIIGGRDSLTVGRVALPTLSPPTQRFSRVAFAETKHAMSLVERICMSVKVNEPVLLTGETGVGKTFIVQYVADNIGQELVVHNLNQQTDSSDFMGGWKPKDVSQKVRSLYSRFIVLLEKRSGTGKHATFVASLTKAMQDQNWESAVMHFTKGTQSVRGAEDYIPNPEWDTFAEEAEIVSDTVRMAKTTFMFGFEEGTLVSAWRQGHWILLDEINLASTEVLERLATVLDGSEELVVTEKGGTERVPRHPNFRVFANMNPPTDVGKKDLPPSLKSRFTEFYVSDPFDPHDLTCVVTAYLSGLCSDAKVNSFVSFFLEVIASAGSKLCDLGGDIKPPHFSLRTLTRALTYIRKATPLYGFNIAIFDGLTMSFASPLQRRFHIVVEQMIVRNMFDGSKPNSAVLPKLPADGKKYVAYEHVWLEEGPETPRLDERFILTSSVREHLKNISRAVFAKRPVLLEGPTSAGKSSMVQYLAELTGHTFVRINNHDSTEIQEYLGHYVSDESGKLRFVDGCLTSAVRNGHWVVLDELNLAPTEVLEALNRLLDDNCELFLPDTNETIHPHPSLRIFATQNPSGAYGGRKVLSRAFRNRFLEITVDDIPTEEITEILCMRYSMAPSFAERMVEVMNTLQMRRQSSHVFAGRHGFITPRDLFRWAERRPEDYQTLAEHGFLLLGERCRKIEERQVVHDVMEKCMKVILDANVIYDPTHWPFVNKYYQLVEALNLKERIVWTNSMQRLFTIVGLCLEHKEPVLLVGETGSSKTTICQVWAAVLEQHLHIINCHQHSEAADFLGSLRPAPPGSSEGLFRWEDGPLVRAMRNGDIFVLDEISLAEDSVLERLNSVLEPSRTLTLAEKSTGEMVVAAELFRALATMNPGGDFGKKELSPALRNRFTEIYVQPITDKAEISLILAKRMSETLLPYADKMSDVLHSVADLRKDSVAHISVRDVVAWAEFMTATEGRCEGDIAFVHGLDTVLLDGLSVGGGLSESSVEGLRAACMEACMKHVTTAPNVLQTPFWNLCSGIEEPVAPQTKGETFFFSAPTTRGNCSKILRGCVLKKAIMLEGSPGVGKTSIVEALGRAFNKFTVRINLSEQTDMMDLLGAFLPRPSEESDEGPRFEWCDGVLLSAVKAGHWVVLDELNLASQSVLEGLNALLDHRSSLYIPELCCEITAHPDFRVFACQNPLIEGGGRKGLPKSFLNRFTKVRISAFTFDDLIRIAQSCTTLNDDLLRKMVHFVCELQKATMEERRFGLRGSPWEFNLRDVLRWAGMVSSEEAVHTVVDALFFQRFRSYGDRLEALRLYNDIFSLDMRLRETVAFTKEDGWLYGDNQKLALPVQDGVEYSPLALPGQSSLVESVVRCAVANQFCILVGPASSGKTSILHSAAALLGVELETFSVTAGCDTIDLLGGYDQVEGRQGQFEWRDSLLLKAMVEGKWLVLDNANFCSASVLDRLNSVVEPHGSLLVNEQGLVNGEVRIVRPHPNFRIFATLDTKFGEISRALRNRAVELFVPPPSIPGVDAFTICAHHEACSDLDSTGVARILSFHREYTKTCYHADTDGTSTTAVDLSSIGAPSIVTVRRTLGSVSHFDGDVSKALEHSYLKMRTATGVRSDSLLPLLENIPISDVSLPYSHAVRASDLHNDSSMTSALKRIIYERACLVLDLGSKSGLLEYFFLRLGGVRVCNPQLLLEVLQNCSRATFDLNDVVAWCGAVTPNNVVGALASIDGSFGTTKGLMQAVTGSGMPPALVQALSEMDSALCEFYSHCYTTQGSDALGLLESSLLFRAAYQTLAGKFSTNTADAVQLLAQLLVAYESVNEKSYVPPTVAASVRNVFDVLRRISNLTSDLAPPPTLLVKGGHPTVKRQAERSLLAEAAVALKEYQDSRPHSERLLEALWGTAAGRSELEILRTMLRMLHSTSNPALLSTLIADHTNTFLHTVPLLTEMEATPLQVVSANVASQGSEWLAASIAELWTVGKVLPSSAGASALTAGAWVQAAGKVVRSVRNATVRDTRCLVDSNAFRSLTGLQRAVNSLIEPMDATVVLSSMCKSVLRWLVGVFVDANTKEKSVATLVADLLGCNEPVIKACARALEEVPELLADDSGAIGVHLALAILYWVKAQLVVPTSLIDPALKQAIIYKALSQQSQVWDEISQTFLQADSEVYGLTTASPYSETMESISDWGKERAKEEKRKYVPRDDETGARFVEMVVFERELLEGMLHPSRISRFRATALHHCPHLKKKHRSEEESIGGVEELRSWASLLRQSSQEMVRRFGGYEDFTVPFQETLSVIALAADLAAQAAEAHQQEMPLDSHLVCHALTFPQLAPALSFPALSLDQNVGEQLTLLDGALADLCSSPWRVPDSEREGLFTAFCNVHSAIDSRVKSEAHEDELAVMYKEKAIIIEDDDEKHRRHLLKMFPNYQQEFENLDDEEEEEEEDAPLPNSDRGRHARMLLNEGNGRRLRGLVESHSKVYFALLMREFESLTIGGSPLGCFRERFDAVASLMRGIPFSCTQYEELSILGGFAARTKSLRDQLKSALQPPTTDIDEKVGAGFNIYQDAQPNEAADAGKHVGGLMALIDPLRAEYPENPTLLRVEKLAVRILNYPVESTPLMRIVVGCEVLLRECYEWERNASKAVSIMNSINAISGCVLRWRRLELYCWPHIFVAKKHELRAFAANTWFRIHTFVMQILGGVFDTPDGEFSRSAVSQFASDFMWQSNIADFTLRKQALTGFGCHLLVRGMSDNSSEALDAGRIFLHTVGFFSQFDTLVTEAESTAVAPLEADLKEFCSIMRWEDATYYAVKATTQKSHTKIGRIIGELEDIFQRRLTFLISEKETQEDGETTLGLPQENPSLGAVSNRERKRIEAEKLREKRTRKGRKQQQITDDTALAKEGTKRFHSTMWVNAQLSDSIEFANETAENLVSEIVRLQLPKTPLNLKQRSLKMLLESMRDAGVPLNHECRLKPWEHVYADGSYVPPLTCMMHTMKRHFPNLFTDGGSDYVKKTYRLVRCVEQLRVAERLPHGDLTVGQARRGSAMCESIVRFVMDAAHALHTVGEVRDALSLCVAAVESTPVGPSDPVSQLPYAPISSLAADIVTYAAQVRWLMGSSDVSSLLQQLSVAAASLQKVTSLIAERLMSSAYVAGQLEEANVKALCSETDGVMQILERADLPEYLRAPLVQLRNSLATHLIGEAVSTKSAQWEANTRIHIQKLRDVIHEHKVDLPPIREPKAAITVGEDGEGADAEEAESEADEINDDSVVQKGCKVLTDLVTALEGASPLLHECYQSSGRSLPSEAVKSSLLREVRDIVQEVDAMAYWVLQYQEGLSWLALVLLRLWTSLLKKGFCKPDEEEGEGEGEGGEGAQQDGTGMDDGKGENDVTDQLDNEDQLMNMKDKEENKEEQGEDEEDKAAEVGTDFEANKERREESDEDSGDDEDDDDDSDKEMGDVDAEDVQEKKKARTEKKQDGREDEGGDAEEVPEDDMESQEGDEMQSEGEEGDETKDYGNKEKEIREADSDRDSNSEQGELVGDNEDAAFDENEGSSGDKSDDDGEGSDKSVDGSGDAESDDDGSTDENKDEDDKKSNQGDEGEERSEEDPDRQEDAEQIKHDQGADSADSGGDDDDDKVDDGEGADKNDQYHGEQDDQTGKEETDPDKERDRKRQRPEDSQGAENEEQDGADQEEDDAGRSWKKQDKNLQSKRKDTSQQQKQSEKNPFKALKEAMQRHKQRTKQLNLDKNVKMNMEDNEKLDDKSDNDGSEVSEDGEFEITAKGKDEGMAPIDELPDLTVANDDINDAEGDDNEDGDESGQQAPRDKRVKRDDEKKPDNVDVKDERDSKKKKDGKKGGKVSLQAEAESDEEEVEEEVEELVNESDRMAAGRELWYRHEAAVQVHAQQLCEQLRLILAPTDADKLQGDYKTGKRINIKKIIPYIASQFKKDRIWLRRTRPNKRKYQVVVAVDDSLSMQLNNAGDITCQAVALLSKTMQQLEVGEFAVLSLGADTAIAHPLAEPFTAESGPRTFSHLTFEQKSTNMRRFLEYSLDYLDTEGSRLSSSIRSNTTQLRQLMFVISDGQITEDRTELRKLMTRAEENGQMVVLIILDIKAAVNQGSPATPSSPVTSVEPAAATPAPKKMSVAEKMRQLKAEREARLANPKAGSSVLEMQIVEFVGSKVIKKAYLNDFPFPYYIVVQDIPSLPMLLADAMKQWFELIRNMGN